MGIATSAHAGWKRILPEKIKGITADYGYTTLNLVEEKDSTGQFIDQNGCGGTNIDFYTSEINYNQAMLLINRASIEGKKLDIYVMCQGTAGRGGYVILQRN